MPTKKPGARRGRDIPKIPESIWTIAGPVMERVYNAAVITDTAGFEGLNTKAEVVVCSSLAKTCDYLFKAYAEDYADAVKDGSIAEGEKPVRYEDFVETMKNGVIRLGYASGDVREYYVVRTPVY